MKKLFAFLLAALLALSAVSCGQSAGTGEDPFTSLYQITTMFCAVNTQTQTGAVKVPAKFNVQTGSLTPLCTDPLCPHSHDSGCPFANMTGDAIHYENNCVYYQRLKDFTSHEKLFMKYDLESGDATVLFEFSKADEYRPDSKPTTGYRTIVREGHFWYIALNDERKPVVTVRVRLSDGKTEVLEEVPNIPFSQYEKQFLFYGEELDTVGLSDGLILADEDGKNEKRILEDKHITIAFDDLIDSGRLLYCTAATMQDGRIDWEHMTLWCYNLKTGEDRIVVESFPDVYLAPLGNYIYYVKYVDDPPYLGKDQNPGGKDKYNRSGGILWRIDIETGVEEKAFELPDYTLAGTEIEAVGGRIIIGYNNIDYNDYTVEATDRGDYYEYAQETGRIVYNPADQTTAIYPEEALELSSSVTITN